MKKALIAAAVAGAFAAPSAMAADLQIKGLRINPIESVPVQIEGPTPPKTMMAKTDTAQGTA